MERSQLGSPRARSLSTSTTYSSIATFSRKHLVPKTPGVSSPALGIRSSSSGRVSMSSSAPSGSYPTSLPVREPVVSTPFPGNATTATPSSGRFGPFKRSLSFNSPSNRKPAVRFHHQIARADLRGILTYGIRQSQQRPPKMVDIDGTRHTGDHRPQYQRSLQALRPEISTHCEMAGYKLRDRHHPHLPHSVHILRLPSVLLSKRHPHSLPHLLHPRNHHKVAIV